MRSNRLRAALWCASVSWLLAGCGSSTIILPADPGDSSTEDTASVDTGGGTDGSGADTGGSDGTSADTTPASDTSDSGVDTAPSCVSPKKICSGACIDPATDNANCGDCGKTCASGTVCTLGVCACPSPKVTCGSACVDVSTDSANCGVCGKACIAGATCKSGVCGCGTGLVDCGTACKDVSSDVTACGSCGTKCADGQVCVSGTCACPTTKPSLCAGTCVDTKTDAKNCGTCGFSCGGGTCVSGACTCSGSLTACSGTCVDTSSDPSNCGGCGKICAAPGKCTSGVCVLPKCRTTAPNVLFYGVTGSMEKPYLPSGVTSTVATETSWRAMTTADFAKYDLIIIGEPDGTGGGPTATDLLTAYDTRNTWGAAITGRIVVSGLDPAYHAGLGTTGATTVLKATLAWLSGGPSSSTSLYVASDWGTRKLDFMSYIGAFSSSEVFANTITSVSTTHPVMIGSTSTSLSSWSNSAHSILTFPSGFTSLATASDTFSTPSTGPVVSVRDASCTP